MNQEVHRMQFMEQRSDGGQEWLCPVCGRHILAWLDPEFHKDVLVEGDIWARHDAFTGGIYAGHTPPPPEPPDPGLEPYYHYMADDDSP